MDYAARREREILEAMESCRARSIVGEGGDLNDPQFTELAAALDEDHGLRARFERVQRADALIKAAFADVPVPADLAGKVLRRLGDETVSRPAAPSGSQKTIQADSPALLSSEQVSPLPKQISRRGLMAGLAAVAASVAIAAAIWMHNHRSPSLSLGQVIDTSMDFFGRDNAPPGEPVSNVEPPADFPISPEIARFRDVRWRRVGNFMGGPAVAYDLPSRGGKATLYVAKCTADGLPQFPPPQPTLSTGGNSAAAWQSGGLLYVLVVRGDAQTYADFLDRSQGPLT
jgi:hypothetical protein